MSVMVPESLMALAYQVKERRAELTKRHAELCALNTELRGYGGVVVLENGEQRAYGGVAFSEPNAEGWCVSYRSNPNATPMSRGFCPAADRARTMPPGAKPAPAELTKRIEEAYAAWSASANAAETAKLNLEASGRAFFDDIVEKLERESG
jgi:hypothetical protein